MKMQGISFTPPLIFEGGHEEHEEFKVKVQGSTAGRFLFAAQRLNDWNPRNAAKIT